MLDKSKKDFEEILLKKMPGSIEAVKKELTPLLNEKLEVESVVKDSVDLLDTDIINQAAIQDSLNGSNQNQGKGQSNTKEKVRVRTIGGLGPHNSTNDVQDNSSDYTYSQYSNVLSDDQSNWRSGYTDTLILIGTGILVLLVFVVSYLMLNYFG